eukprot:TRINITY_DN726_c0_g1_i1.p1 TRINITY_DN726_c0_g1~~TRINITY_DN726_c0_g1_i1.p1  ORF type:complete len:486 (+),score=85.80 TRINITY_DN726_c0_g1_i1:168-1625(+)
MSISLPRKDGLTEHDSELFDPAISNLYSTLRELAINFLTLCNLKRFEEAFQIYVHPNLEKLQSCNGELLDEERLRSLCKWESLGVLKSFGKMSIERENDCHVVHQSMNFFADPKHCAYSFPFTRVLQVVTLRFIEDFDQLYIYEISTRREGIEAQNAEYVLRTKSPLRVSTRSTFEVNKGDHLLLLFMKPPSLLQQEIIEMKALTESSMEVPMQFHSRLVDGCEIYQIEANETVTVEILWDFKQRFLDENDEDDEFKSHILPHRHLSDEERECFTKHDARKYNFMDPKFQRFKDMNGLETREKESEISFAHRVQSILRRKFLFSSTPETTDKGGVAQLVVDTKADASGLALILSSVLRANGIPARLLQGHLCIVDVRDQDEKIKRNGIHTVCEFYAEGVGWIPVEFSESGVLFGCDRSAPHVLAKHFDCIYEVKTSLPTGTVKTDRPNFLTNFHPVILKTTERRESIFSPSRQKHSSTAETVRPL